MKAGQSLIKPVEDAAQIALEKDKEVMAYFCQDDNLEIGISDIEEYKAGKEMPDINCAPGTKKIGVIHSHTLNNNKLSYFDIRNDIIRKSNMACVTCDDGTGKMQTRCYILNPNSDFIDSLDEYFTIYRDLNKSAEAFLIDAVGKWIIKEMII